MLEHGIEQRRRAGAGRFGAGRFGEDRKGFMRHKTFRLSHLRLNGVPVAVHYGDLLVAQGEAAVAVDWEVVVSTLDELRLVPASYDVHMETLEARQLWGLGLLVRSDGRAHVFRGGGSLDGFSPADFSA